MSANYRVLAGNTVPTQLVVTNVVVRKDTSCRETDTPALLMIVSREEYYIKVLVTTLSTCATNNTVLKLIEFLAYMESRNGMIH